MLLLVLMSLGCAGNARVSRGSSPPRHKRVPLHDHKTSLLKVSKGSIQFRDFGVQGCQCKTKCP